MRSEDFFKRVVQKIRQTPAAVTSGRVIRATGLLLEAHLPGARIGSLVEVEREGDVVPGEVVGFRDDLALITPLSDIRLISPGALVKLRNSSPDIPVSEGLLGRMIDPFGNPIDGGPPIFPELRMPIEPTAPMAIDRARIEERMDTGIRVIDGMLTCGKGQRVGIFAGAGVGKTMLIQQIARQSKVDVLVMGLIGERGGEVRDLLSSGNDANRVMVVATSDRSPLERARGAQAATTVAEYFRDKGKSVLLVIDSLTRYAMALREIGLSAGEPPATKGYTPSVFAAMPRLLERAAPMSSGGSITAFYTVLVEGDDLSDPVADSARSLLDGHFVLSRDIAAKGHFPAIDVLASASRVAHKVTPPPVQTVMQKARAILALRKEADELRSLGAYVPGSNPAYDRALALGGKLDQWMKQNTSEMSNYDIAMKMLTQIVETRGGES